MKPHRLASVPFVCTQSCARMNIFLWKRVSSFLCLGVASLAVGIFVHTKVVW